MSIIESCHEALRCTLSPDDFEDAYDAAIGSVNIALVRYSHLAGMSLWRIGVASWLVSDLEPCMDDEEAFFRSVRNMEFGIPEDEEIKPIVRGSADEIAVEARAFRRAIVRRACFEGWPMLRLNTAITILLGKRLRLNPTIAGAMIREEFAYVWGAAA